MTASVATYSPIDPYWPEILSAARLARTGTANTAGALQASRWARPRAPAPQTRPLDHGRRSGKLLRWDSYHGWMICADVEPQARQLIELYLPAASASASRPLCVAHLGQSLDGFIATESGDSFFVTGSENITHLHRMRALCDAVLVGAETVLLDNPQLTTRRVAGAHPVRVVLDPSRRLDADHRLFNDAAAPTLWLCAEELASHGAHAASCEVVGVPCLDGRLDLAALVAMLAARGLNALFVEGGGVTVSAFLAAGQLDRLQLAVAPVLLGEGRPGVRFPGSSRLSDCLRPPCRLIRLGDDVLYDCDVTGWPGTVRNQLTESIKPSSWAAPRARG